MKTTINLSVFKNAIKDLSKSGASWYGLQIIAEDASVTMTAGESPTVQKKIDAITSEVGSITISFDTLKKITPKLKGNTITLETSGPGLQVTCDNINLFIDKVDDMIIDFKPVSTFSIASTNFISGIKKVVHSTSKSESRPVLQAIKMKVDKGQLKLVSTDSHRLAEVITPIIDTNPGDVIMLPLAAELKKIYTMNWDTTLKVGMDDNGRHMIISDDLGTVVMITVAQGNYPDTDRLMPTTHASTLQATVSELLEAAETAEIVLKTSDVRNSFMLLDLVTGVSLLSAEGKGSHIKIELDAYTGDEISIAFNPTYFKEALKTFDKTDKVELGFTSALRPFTVSGPGNIQLITPIRTGR